MLLLLSLCRVKTQWSRMHHERFTEFRISCSEWLIVAVGVVLEFCRFSMSMILRMMARYYQSAVTADIGPTDPWYKKCRGPVLCWFVEIHWEYWTTCLTLGTILLNPWWSGGVSDNTLLNLNPTIWTEKYCGIILSYYLIPPMLKSWLFDQKHHLWIF